MKFTQNRTVHTQFLWTQLMQKNKQKNYHAGVLVLLRTTKHKNRTIVVVVLFVWICIC
jgi:hypothetical protein